eukprot:4465639-Pleurochrysis_carterae.AAC.2
MVFQVSRAATAIKWVIQNTFILIARRSCRSKLRTDATSCNLHDAIANPRPVTIDVKLVEARRTGCSSCWDGLRTFYKRWPVLCTNAGTVAQSIAYVAVQGAVQFLRGPSLVCKQSKQDIDIDV